MPEETLNTSPAGSCPECQSEDVKQKMSFRTVLILFGLLILDYVLLATTHYSPTNMHPVTKFLVFGAGVLALMILIGLLAAIFGKNACRSCGHKWR